MKGPNGLRFNCNLFCNWIVDYEGEELISGLRFNCNRQLAIGGNTGNEVGSMQNDEFRSHNHSISNNSSAYKPDPAWLAYTWQENAAYHQHKILADGGQETRPKNANVN